MEEENRANGEIRKTLSHYKHRKTDGKKGLGINRQMYKKFNEGLKREVKFGVHPPGLTYGGVGEVFFNQAPKDLPRRRSH